MVEILEIKLKDLEAKEVISGMAVGFDTALAIASIRSGIPLTCAIPFEGQEKKWPKEAQERYKKIIKKAKHVVYVNSGKYEAWKMYSRNEWMVDHSNILLAYWDGKFIGGTYKCVLYAKNQDEPIINIY